MFTYEFGMQETLAIAVALLLLGRWIKNQIPLLKRFFIPAYSAMSLSYSNLPLITN